MDLRRTGVVFVALISAITPAQKRPTIGQGPVEKGPVRVADLDFGKHWFGPKLRHDELIGKVVLVELWGS